MEKLIKSIEGVHPGIPGLGMPGMTSAKGLMIRLAECLMLPVWILWGLSI